MREVRCPKAFDLQPEKMIHKYVLPADEAQPVQLVLHGGSRMVQAELVLIGNPHYCLEWWLYYEVRQPFEDTYPHIFQTFHLSHLIPRCAEHVASAASWDGRRAVPQTTYHLYEYPRGTRMFDPEMEALQDRLRVATNPVALGSSSVTDDSGEHPGADSGYVNQG